MTRTSRLLALPGELHGVSSAIRNLDIMSNIIGNQIINKLERAINFNSENTLS